MVANKPKRRLTAAADLRKVAAHQPRTGQATKAQPFIPLAATDATDKNSFYVRDVTKKFIAADMPTRQSMMSGGLVDSVLEEGELIPVVGKKLDREGKVIDYRKWDPAQGNLCVIETRTKKDGTDRLLAGQPIRPWWGINLWGVTKNEHGKPELKFVQLDGDSCKDLDLGKIPWFRPCELIVTESWTLKITKDDLSGPGFIREMKNPDAVKDFTGTKEFDEVDLKTILQMLKNSGGSNVFCGLRDGANNDFRDLFCADVSIRTRKFDAGQQCMIADATTGPTPVSCSFYPRHVKEQLANADGGAYGLVFFRPRTRTKSDGTVVDTVDLFGALVYQYDEAQPAEEQP